MDSITELEDFLRDAGGFNRAETKTSLPGSKGLPICATQISNCTMHAAAQRIILNFTQGK